MLIRDFMMMMLCVGAVSIGQILFKLGASGIVTGSGHKATLMSVVMNPSLVIAFVVYIIATALWVIVLMRMPLRVAYPFMSLAFVLVPLLAGLILGEPLSARLFLGGVIIMAGVYLVATS